MTEKKVALKAIKIGLLGDSQVGKTALIRALMDYEFEPDIISTIGNVKFEKKFELKDGNTIKLILWDSAGEERFRSVALSTLRAVSGIVLVFDVSLRSSFENVTSWMEEIKESLNDPCLVLFGNKIDKDPKEWEVTEEEAINFAKENNLVYFETSAKTKQGIDEGFSHIINVAYERITGKSKNLDIENNDNNDNNNENNNNVIILEQHDEDNKEEYEEIKTGCFGRKKKRKKKKKNIEQEDKKKIGV